MMNNLQYLFEVMKGHADGTKLKEVRIKHGPKGVGIGCLSYTTTNTWESIYLPPAEVNRVANDLRG